RSDSSAIPSLWHATLLEASESSLEVAGSRQSPDSLPCGVVLELRPLPSTGVTRLPRYYEPLRHPARHRSVPRGLVGWRSRPSVVSGFPCYAPSPCMHAVATTPAEPLEPSLMLSSGGGLPPNSAGSAPAARAGHDDSVTSSVPNPPV